MPSVLLLHTNREYATSLADTIDSVNTDYDIDVISRSPIRNRISHLLCDYDLIQTDELMINGPLALLISIYTKKPFVVSIRGWADYTNAHNQNNLLSDFSIKSRTRCVLSRTEHVIYISKITRKKFEQRYRVNNSTIAHRPIDVSYYNSASNYAPKIREKDSSSVLLTVTNLRYKEKFKGIKHILEGIKTIFKNRDDIRYQIAGDGKYKEDLKEYLDNYPFRDRVEVLGYRKDIPRLLTSADLFIYVSYLDSLATVILEAQAAGLPIVAGRASGVPEAVGEAGILCSPTPGGIGSAVERVLEDDSFRAELAKKSKDKMAAYNEKCARRHIEVWNDVLDYS